MKNRKILSPTNILLVLLLLSGILLLNTALRNVVSEILSNAFLSRRTESTNTSAVETQKIYSKVVSTNLASDEMLSLLVEPEKVVALTRFADDPDYSNAVDFAKKIPNRINALSDNIEDIVLWKADIIISYRFNNQGAIDILKKFNQQVVTLNNQESIADILGNFRQIAKLTGKAELASKIVNDFQKRLSEISTKANKNKKEKVLFLGVDGTTLGQNTIWNEVLSMLNCANASAVGGVRGVLPISLENIVEWNPDLIIVHGTKSSTDNKVLELYKHPSLKNVSAILRGNIRVIPEKYIQCLSPYIIDGIEILFSFIGK